MNGRADACVRRISRTRSRPDMPKKTSPTSVDQNQGFVMTEEGLLIPGKFLRKMGEKISVASSFPGKRGAYRRCPQVFQCVCSLAGSRLAGLKSVPL